MSKVTIPTEYEKATLELAQGAGQFIVDLVKALGDGFQPVRDTLAIVQAGVNDLVPVAATFAQLPLDMKEDLGAFMLAWTKAGVDTYNKLKK
jgi:hypothetical protein